MDQPKDKSKQPERGKSPDLPERSPGDNERRADGDQAHLGQSFVTWANAGILAFHMVSGMLVGIFLGYYLDKWLNSSPVCVGIGLILGLVAGGLNMYRDMRRFLREQAAEDAREKLRRMGQVEGGDPSRQDGGNRAAEPSENHVFREGDPRASARTADREVDDQEKLRRMGQTGDEAGAPDRQNLSPTKAGNDAKDGSNGGDGESSNNDDDYSDPSSGYGRGDGEEK